MKKNTIRMLALSTALLMLAGCAGEAADLPPLAVMQSSQVMLPDLSRIPSNEDISLEDDQNPPASADDKKDTQDTDKSEAIKEPEKVPIKQPSDNTGSTSGNSSNASGSSGSTSGGSSIGSSDSASSSGGSSGSTSGGSSTGSNESSSSGNTSGSGSDSSGSTTPAEILSVRSGGQTVTGEAYDIICRVVQNEVGSSFETEAIKAMAVASYSYIKYYNAYLSTAPSLSLSGSVSTKVANAVKEVLGQAVYYNGRYANCTYFAVSAGCTTSASSVWGTTQYPYLVSVDSAVDTAYSTGWSSYKTLYTFSADALAQKMNAVLGTTLDAAATDPGTWIEILSRTDGLYVGSVRVGDKTTTGRNIRDNILGLRSHAFDVSYDAASGNFTFTVYGYGHGVGMSQIGANYYAQQGWSYTQILTHYYSGTSVS